MKLTFAALLVLLPFALASPVLERRQVDMTSHCGQWDTVTAGSYELFLDQWGISGATGSQCAQITSLSESMIAWKTNWTWSGGNGVKTFSNIQQNDGVGVQLSAIKSMPSTWKWSYDISSGAVADVAYDLFTASSLDGANVNEIMIWLANYNAGSISATYGADGKPTPVASGLSIAGQTWNLYFGSNGANNVYSFLPSSGNTVTSFSGDINDFFTYLTSEQGVATSQYLKTAQAGTEPTSGSGTLTTSAYSLVIN
ncbi:uncharacterized protein FOMMEDRAFT_25513 [Fomitiporia mediterranea MF3/22]|uniref:uncharacterized protein n=1 Tax=Fomitiporia mediterranea (strain MF3/22) TaxID=694068 RepID=UPI0004408332|nr:uncharacterized protein FOMMEDRAFT_25513 [Fomitiporia mediterranea MF3/22]EJD08448.1 hypothetical protein FOMMEDRAFT_25513 [Fomitiporia mediterranea MF3/22]